MAVTSFLPGQVTGSAFGAFVASLYPVNIRFLGHRIYVMLLTSGYTPDQDAHYLKSHVDAFETTGTNYSPGGMELTGAYDTVTYDSGTKKTTFDAEDALWVLSTITAHYAVVYDIDSPGQPILLTVNFGADVSSSSSTFTIAWSADGLFTGTVAAI